MKKQTILILIVLIMSACVQETHTKTVHFKIDMKEVENPTKVGIRGQMPPLSWDETIFLTDENQDSIFEATVKFNTAQPNTEFKFLYGDNRFELECEGNRMLEFEYIPQELTYSAKFNHPENVVE